MYLLLESKLEACPKIESTLADDDQEPSKAAFESRQASATSVGILRIRTQNVSHGGDAR